MESVGGTEWYSGGDIGVVDVNDWEGWFLAAGQTVG